MSLNGMLTASQSRWIRDTLCDSMRREGENRCGQGQTQTKPEWDGTSDGDDMDRPQMADGVGGDITRYRALVARISYHGGQNDYMTGGFYFDLQFR